MGKRVKKSLSTLKLYDKIVLSATVILIIISLILTVVSIDNITKSKIEEVEQYLTTLTMDFKDNVDGFLKEKIDLLKFIASFPEIYNMNWDEQYKFLKEKTIYSKRGKEYAIYICTLPDGTGSNQTDFCPCSHFSSTLMASTRSLIWQPPMEPHSDSTVRNCFWHCLSHRS